MKSFDICDIVNSVKQIDPKDGEYLLVEVDVGECSYEQEIESLKRVSDFFNDRFNQLNVCIYPKGEIEIKQKREDEH